MASTSTKDLTKDVKENIKREPEEPPKVYHNQHSFKVQFDQSTETFTVCCTQPQTVLDAIKTLSAYKKNITCPEGQIILQLGRADKKTAIATHFPCTLIKEGELIVVYSKNEKVEVTGRHEGPQDEYSVFYIETKGGKYAKTKAKQTQGLFRSSAIKDFTQLCVYGARGITVKKALESDGRFVNTPDDFKLSDVDDTDLYTECTQPIDNLHNKTFRICF